MSGAPVLKRSGVSKCTKSAGVFLVAGSFLLATTPALDASGPPATFAPKADFGTGLVPYSVALGDVNGDGDLDLTTANAGANTASVLLGDGAGGFGTKADFGTGDLPWSVALGDVNGDLHLDLTTANYGDDTASVLLNTAVFAQAITFPQPPDTALDQGPITLDATATSELPVTYTSNTPTVCDIDGSGTKAVLNAVGTCTITADQEGSPGWSPAVPLPRSFQVTSPDPTDTSLVTKARAKNKKLKPGKLIKVVRKTTTDGQIKKAKTNCYVFGNKLTGKDKRAVCKIKTKKTSSNAKVWVKPKCSVGVKVRVKIVAQADGATKTKWQRTWKVKNKPRTYCPISGNG